MIVLSHTMPAFAGTSCHNCHVREIVKRDTVLFVLTSCSNEDELIPQNFYLYESTFILGETDWKIIAIDVNDPLADELKGKYFILQLTT